MDRDQPDLGEHRGAGRRSSPAARGPRSRGSRTPGPLRGPRRVRAEWLPGIADDGHERRTHDVGARGSSASERGPRRGDPVLFTSTAALAGRRSLRRGKNLKDFRGDLRPARGLFGRLAGIEAGRGGAAAPPPRAASGRLHRRDRGARARRDRRGRARRRCTPGETVLRHAQVRVAAAPRRRRPRRPRKGRPKTGVSRCRPTTTLAACRTHLRGSDDERNHCSAECPGCGEPKLERLIGGGAGFVFQGSATTSRTTGPGPTRTARRRTPVRRTALRSPAEGTADRLRASRPLHRGERRGPLTRRRDLLEARIARRPSSRTLRRLGWCRPAPSPPQGSALLHPRPPGRHTRPTSPCHPRATRPEHPGDLRWNRRPRAPQAPPRARAPRPSRAPSPTGPRSSASPRTPRTPRRAIARW